MSYSVYEVMEATGGTLVRGAAGRAFVGISTDSRSIQEGKLFIPLKGLRFNGHAFLSAAADSGAAGFLVGEGEEDNLRGISKDITVIRVQDTLQALGDLARFRRKKLGLPVLAITGSAGKTTTKEMAASIMGMIRNTLKTEGNFNNLVGLPLTLLRLRDEHEVAIVEMGTNEPGEIARLSRIAVPDVGLITNIGPAHLEGLRSLDVIREEKGELFRNMAANGIAVVNRDDEAVQSLADRRRGEKVTFGIKAASDVHAEDIAGTPRGASFILRIGEEREKVAMAAAGTHNVMNALAAAAASLALGADIETIRRGLEAFRPIPARMEIHRLKNGAFLIDDTYNANPLSVREALMSLKSLRGEGSATVILGDMLELGERAEELHREMGGVLAATGVDAVFLKGVFSRATAEGAQKKGIPAERIFFPSTAEEIVAYLLDFFKAGDWALVKGSRAMKMEEIVRRIVETFGIEDDRQEKG